MGFSYTVFSSPGRGKKYNEDAVDICEISDGVLGILCDGVGSDNGGDLAARLVTKSIARFFETLETDDYLERIKLSIQEANQFVVAHSSINTSVDNMATTVDVVFVKQNFIYWGHLGDSRIYLFRDGKLNQVSKDHSLVQKLVDEGFITLKQAENHPRKNVILKAIGNKSGVEPDLSKMKLNDFVNTKIFMCSDGIHNLLTKQEIESIISDNDFEGIKQNIQQLVEARGALDDYSFICINIENNNDRQKITEL